MNDNNIKYEDVHQLFLKINNLKNWQQIQENIASNDSIIHTQPWNSQLIPIIEQQKYLKNLWHQYDECFHEFQWIKLLIDSNDSNSLDQLYQQLYSKLQQLYKLLKFNDDDFRDVILEIHSGSGGDDAEDWAMMLYKMYIGWINKNQYNYEILEWQPSSVGLKYCSMKITNGYILYGTLKNETGIHRLVRLSPFNANNKRQTSFTSVNILPLVQDDNTIEINPKDLKIDTYRSSGAGGQHVNTTDSAVRITYLPKNIVVQCQNERSQHANKETALKMLKSKLLQIKLEEQLKLNENINKNKQSIDFGHQKRSYILHPYQLIKDHLTGVETSKTLDVLKGDIDIFLE